jgi:hypothetical protein
MKKRKRKSVRKRAKKRVIKVFKKELLIGIVISLLIGFLIGFLAFGIRSPISNLSGNCIKAHWSCNIDLSKVNCYHDSRCLPINGVCNLQTYKCVPANLDAGFSPLKTEEECSTLGGEWILSEGC